MGYKIQYNIMDDVLIAIKNIKDINYIKFYDLTANDSNGLIVVPTLIINYGNNSTMNMSVKDIHFHDFVQKVIDVYQEEKKDYTEVHEVDVEVENNGKKEIVTKKMIPSDINPETGEIEYTELPPFFTKKIVVMNKRTKAILDKTDILNKNEISSFYENKDGFTGSYKYEIDEVKSIMSIVKYMISEFMKFANLNVEINSDVNGYQTEYTMETKINGEFVYLTLLYDKLNENDYKVAAYFDDEPLDIEISFDDDSVYVKGKYKSIAISYEFSVNKKNGYYLKEIFRDGNLVNFDPGNLPVTDINDRNLIDLEKKDNSKWYLLPWGGYLGFNGKEERVDDTTTIDTNHVTYYEKSTDNFYKREFYTKKVERDATDTKKASSIVLDELRKITSGYNQKPYYVIETLFRNARGDGIYQEKYNGKYFYHIVEADDLSKVDKDNLISVKKEDINDISDLVNESVLNKIGGRK